MNLQIIFGKPIKYLVLIVIMLTVSMDFVQKKMEFAELVRVILGMAKQTNFYQLKEAIVTALIQKL